MAYDIKQSSTECALMFLMVQSADHISALTGASPTVTLSKNGGAFASPSGAVSEVANGWYKVAANATDTNTLGPLVLHATATSGDPTDMVVGNIVKYDPQLADLGLTVFQLTESYAANGTAPTVAQVLMAIQQFQQQKSTSGTAMTIKKLDGSTTAMGLTLNDSSNPTSITRSS